MLYSILDNDLYKFYMGQFIWAHYRDLQVEFSLINRSNIKIGKKFKEFDTLLDTDTLKMLKNYIDGWINSGLLPYEKRYLINLGFNKDYVNYLGNLYLDSPDIFIDDNDDLNINVSGKWAEVTYFEVPIMFILTELFYLLSIEYEMKSTGLNSDVLKDNMFSKYECKNIDMLVSFINGIKNNPSIKFMEFGTRRRYSNNNQYNVISILKNNLPEENFIGTSNVKIAMDLCLQPRGTVAHEIDMILGGLANNVDDLISKCCDYRKKWEEMYGIENSVLLTDTFTSDFFYKNIYPEFSHWNTIRQDSGDPVEFAIKTCNIANISKKNIIYSDNLNINSILSMHDTLSYYSNPVYGIGTYLSNSVYPHLPIVMKPTKVENRPVVKLSDEPNKTTGEKERVDEIMSWINN